MRPALLLPAWALFWVLLALHGGRAQGAAAPPPAPAGSGAGQLDVGPELGSGQEVNSTEDLTVEAERQALLDFKAGLQGGGGAQLEGWAPGADMCSWEGVGCDSDGHVLEL